jgi:2'-5' RNA ligase
LPKKTLPKIKELRLAAPENLHITVKFLGNVPEKLIPNLIRKLEQKLDQSKNFQLKLEKVKFSPNQKQARMIWVEFKRHPLFKKLIDDIDGAVEEIAETKNNLKKLC